MYFETKLIKDARLSAMNDEELINLLNEAADKTNQDPDSFFIFPYGVYSDYIFLLIKYIQNFNLQNRDKQIESYNKANNIKVTDTSFKYIITPDGKCLADGVIKDDVVNLSLDSKNKEIYDNYIKNKDNGKVYTEGD